MGSQEMGSATISRSGTDAPSLPKCATGIQGLDEITGGGLPRGRPTLVSGSAGCGKTLLALEFVVRGAMQYDEPGVFVAFEERPTELAENVRSLGFDLDDLEARGLLVIDYVHLERSEIDETGEYDLEGLFIRLGHAIDSIGAKRVVLDTIETLFAGLSDHSILRAELRRLFQWLKNKGVSVIITCERGEGALTRHGIEEYVSDCVILLDHRVTDQLSTRRLRVVKYRGSAHGTDEFPFIIDEKGIVVLPITSARLEHRALSERVSSGIPRLDAMLGTHGFYRGSTILVSGTAGTGKTSVAAHFADAACRRGERVVFASFEESPSQLLRNARSIGMDFEPWVKKGLMRIHAARPTVHGLEMHLVAIHKLVTDYRPSVLIIDPITNLTRAGSLNAASSMLLRVIDYLKNQEITALFTALTSAGGALESSDVGVSSIVDTWLLLRDVEANGERNRCLYVLKSRGMPHSNQLREYSITSQGIEIVDVYVGSGGVLTGSSRLAQEARGNAEAVLRQQAIERKRRELARKRLALEAKIASLQAEFDAEEEDLQEVIEQEQAARERLERDRSEMARSRHADANGEERVEDRSTSE